MNMFQGMFGKVAPGMCRLSADGNIAVKTSSGFKSYNMKTGRLTNCDRFVFHIGEEFFFLIPTNKVELGDIILVGGQPRCVIAREKNMLTVINYEDSTVENVLPEHHMFLGSTYFYGKIVSMFGRNSLKGKKGPGRIMKYMMINEMMKSNDGNAAGKGEFSGLNSMLPLLLLNKDSDSLFDGMFDFEEDEPEEEEDTTEDMI